MRESSPPNVKYGRAGPGDCWSYYRTHTHRVTSNPAVSPSIISPQRGYFPIGAGPQSRQLAFLQGDLLP